MRAVNLAPQNKNTTKENEETEERRISGLLPAALLAEAHLAAGDDDDGRL
jgi:hypothetical protein